MIQGCKTGNKRPNVLKEELDVLDQQTMSFGLVRPKPRPPKTYIN